jgi:hypothetical protein
MYIVFGILIVCSNNPMHFQPKTKRVKVKKVAPAPYAAAKPVPKKTVNPLIEKRPKNFGIGMCTFLSLFMPFQTLTFISNNNYQLLPASM